MIHHRIVRTSAWAPLAAVVLLGAAGCERRDRTEPTGEQTREETQSREGLPEDKRGQTRAETEAKRAEKERGDKADKDKAGTEADKDEADKDKDKQATVQTTKAVETIVSARCDREARCKNVGPVRTYTSDKACKSELTMKGKDDLRACDTGVRQGELKECVAAISDEDCNNPLDALDRIKECRTSELCG